MRRYLLRSDRYNALRAIRAAERAVASTTQPLIFTRPDRNLSDVCKETKYKLHLTPAVETSE
jgi:hypothetical protein